jgi:hypothetical protein
MVRTMGSGVGMAAGVRAVVEAIEGTVHRSESLRPSQQQHEGHKGPDGATSHTHEGQM